MTSPSGTYLHRDPKNAFCSVWESWSDPVTCWADWHNLLGTHMPVLVVEREPTWLQVVHGGNVSNRVRGRRVRPSRYRAMFGAMLDDAAEPSRGELIRDLVVGVPLRSLRDATRVGLKSIILRVGGKDALDQLKARFAPIKARFKRKVAS